MPACSGEHIVYPLSALISEPGHREADGAHVSAGGGPPQRASTCGAGFVRPVLGAPVREGGSQLRPHCPGMELEHRARDVQGGWQAVRHDGHLQAWRQDVPEFSEELPC